MKRSSRDPEIAAYQNRNRRSMVGSLIIHVLLLGWLSTRSVSAPEGGDFTEITWLEDEALTELAPPPPPATAPDPVPSEPAPPEPAPSGTEAEENFLREDDEGDVAPEPQTLEALDDRLREQLTSAPAHPLSRPSSVLAAAAGPDRVVSSRLAAAPTDVATGSGTTLTRGPAAPTSSEPIALRRGSSRVPAAALSVSDLPETRRATRAASTPGDSTAVRHLAGASLMGQVADRPLEAYTIPTYPEWAKGEGVEASVSLYFEVRSDGQIKPNIVVQKTAGFADFDRNAIDALSAWRFAPLSGGSMGEQWGSITFNYRLKDEPGR